ncbi:MAG: PP2C family protein-serine/threonine phosphatase [Candidatus Acidiferrales bacterium]
MKKTPTKRATGSPLENLARSIGTLQPEASPGEIAGQVVAIVAAERGFSGARLWRLEKGSPVVWHEKGELPAARAEAIGEMFAGGGSASSNGSLLLCGLGPEQERLAVLEAHSAGSLTAEMQSWLELFRRYAEVALEASERKTAVVELSTIVEAAKQLNSTLDLGELINIILRLATRQTHADRGTVFLYDKATNEIWSLVGLGLQQHEIRLPTSRGIAGWVAQHGEAVNLADVYEDARFEPEVDRRLGYRTKSLLCLPIRGKDGEVVGVLQLLNKKTGAFTAGDDNFLRALSDHVALALENAQLHRERLAKQKMERDLALARSIQQGLLPEAPPQIAGFDIYVSHRPSLMVGGDYYDFVPIGPDTLLTVVADVEGKGVSSAMVMANLQATLHALLAHLHSLERLVSSLSDMMLNDTRGQKYMTMFVCLLDQRHPAIHYVNAGHVPPAVVHADGSAEFLREGGMVAGLFPGTVYDRGCVPLKPGDILVACTDGITEAMNKDDDEFGSERLVELVRRERLAPAQEIVEKVLAEVDLFSRGGTHEDDRVILIIKML